MVWLESLKQKLSYNHTGRTSSKRDKCTHILHVNLPIFIYIYLYTYIYVYIVERVLAD